MASEFMQAVYEGAVANAASASGAQELRGLSKVHFLEAVKRITDALGEMDANTNLHVAILATTYVRNAFLATMAQNQQVLATQTGGTG